MLQITKVPKEELLEILKIFNKVIGRFIIFVFFLFLDGTYFAENVVSSKLPINILAVLAFFRMYFKAYKRLKILMIFAVIVGFFGEYFFSVFLGMYTYRLENVPFYVPLGHAALYGRIFYFSKASVVRKNNKAIEQILYILISLFTLSYLVLFKDIFGFLMTTCVFILLIKRPKDRLFFLSMYFLVAILEIGGTAFGCWKWPSTAFGVFDFLPSNNPPSGISLFYFLLDISCFLLYILFSNKSWTRLKQIRKIKK